MQEICQIPLVQLIKVILVKNIFGRRTNKCKLGKKCSIVNSPHFRPTSHVKQRGTNTHTQGREKRYKKKKVPIQSPTPFSLSPSRSSLPFFFRLEENPSDRVSLLKEEEQERLGQSWVILLQRLSLKIFKAQP